MKYKTCTLALCSLTASLGAQNESTSLPLQTLDPVYVTGDLWLSELQNISASVSVLTEESLQTNGVQHFEDVINSIPNITWTGGTSRPRYIQIRGIGENSQFEGETPDASVRFLIDDLDLTGLGTVGNLFDVEQVEVLRGPQAGAFGANAAGGVVKFASNGPTPYWSGQAEASVGEYNLKSGGIAVGGPLLENTPETLTFRFALHQLNSDGFLENRFLNRSDVNERDELTSRLKLRWLANENLDLNATVFYADADNGYDAFSLDNNGAFTYSDEPGRDEQETVGTSLRAHFYELEATDITYIGQFTQTDSLYSYDSDWGAGYFLPVGDPASSGYFGFLELGRERNVYSNEIRFDSKGDDNALGIIDRWTFGLYQHTLSENSDLNYRDEFATGAVTSDYDSKTYAAFGQIAHDPSDRTRLIFGLRYEYHSVDFVSNTTEDYFGSLVAGRTASSQDNHLFGGKITLEHDLTEQQHVFASIGRGYKAGGANSGAFSNPGDPATYQDETLWNYEVGLRSNWLDGKLDTSITVFYLDRQDAQLRDSAGAGGFFRYFTSNQGDATHTGIETEAKWYFTKNWIFSTHLGLLETEADVSNEDIANAPSYTYSARLDYMPSEGFFGGIEVAGSDAYFESNSHAETRSAYNVVNASVGYRLQNWTLTIWAKNLLDEAYENRVFLFDNFDPDGLGEQRYESPAPPQQFGATLNYSF